MDTINKRSFDKRAVLGILLTLAGGLLLADNMGWLDNTVSRVIFSWPMILVVAGLVNLTQKNHVGFGVALIAAGIFFIIPRIADVPHNYNKLFWAFAFVAIGLLFIFRSKKEEFCCSNSDQFSSDLIDEVNIFGGSEKKLTTQTFRGGKITSIFGGSNYDMLDCRLAEGKNVLDMVNVFGGSKILVPGDWKIHVEVISIFGGFADKRRNVVITAGDSNKELYITGVAIFGGGEIKSI